MHKKCQALSWVRQSCKARRVFVAGVLGVQECYA